MKRFWNTVLVATAIGLLVLAAGCSKSSSNPASANNETDQSALQAIMTEDSALEAVNSWSGDSLDTVGGSPLDSAVTPIYWERRGQWERQSVDVAFQGDTMATITRVATFNGTIHILIDTTGGVRHGIDKPMHNTLTRKAMARRIGRSNYPRQNWRIYKVTPEVLLSSDVNTVHPARVRFFLGGDTTGTPVLDISDPLNTFFSRDSLPAVPPGSELLVVVTPNVTDTVAAFLHPHVWLGGRFHRKPMLPAGSNSYSASLLVGNEIGLRLTAPDVFKYATLHTSDAAYDAGSWAIPYRVVAIP